MTDSFGRTINYLRLSVTDRCNLRCLYCMPKEGIKHIAHNEVLRFEEMLKICGILAKLGIKNIRITGGEPLVRRGITEFIGELKKVPGIERITMTSNGILLGENLDALIKSGLDGLNISIDTLNKEMFEKLTGTKDGFKNILPAIDKALENGINVKINCVPLSDFNEKEIAKLAALAKNRKLAVRFIELMPLGQASLMQFIPMEQVMSLIEKEHGSLQAITQDSNFYSFGSGPAEYYKPHGFTGSIGIISSISKKYCKTCNRLRLTSKGELKTCLASDNGTDIKKLIRKGAANEEISQIIIKAVKEKPQEHNFNEKKQSIKMFSIGG